MLNYFHPQINTQTSVMVTKHSEEDAHGMKLNQLNYPGCGHQNLFKTPSKGMVDLKQHSFWTRRRHLVMLVTTYGI